MISKKWSNCKSLDSIDETEYSSRCLTEDGISSNSTQTSANLQYCNLYFMFMKKFRSMQIDKEILFKVISKLTSYKLKSISEKRKRILSVCTVCKDSMLGFQSLKDKHKRDTFCIIKIQSRLRGNISRQLFKLLKLNIELENECKLLIRKSKRSNASGN